jgi:uncharacterized protein YodC (DUF2158 family)
MNARELEMALTASYPVDRERLARLDLEAMEADLFDDVEAAGSPPTLRASGRRPRVRPRLAIGFAAVAAAIVAALILVLGGGAGEQTPRAYGAELVRFAESTPLLLLEGPEWGVRSVDQQPGGEGHMEFTERSPDPHPNEPLMTRSDVKHHITPQSVIERRQRRVELIWHDADQTRLLWHDGKLGRSLYDTYLHKRVAIYEPGPAFKTTIPSLGVTAYIATRTENARIQGGPGDRLMVAIWVEGNHLIEFRASVPDLAGFRQRLDWLHRVNAQTWLGAMPPQVVKAAEYGATVDEMLRGIPLPPGFDPKSIPDLGVTTDRYQVGAAVGGSVACAWFDSWGQARAADDTKSAREAERVLLASETRWPIFNEMRKEGGYPATVIEYAKKMRSGRWYGKPLLQAVDSEGGLCGPETAGGGGH